MSSPWGFFALSKKLPIRSGVEKEGTTSKTGLTIAALKVLDDLFVKEKQRKE